MLLDNINVHATLLTTGENIIACKAIKEVFFNVFQITVNENTQLLKSLHRRIKDDVVVVADVVIGGETYKNIEFKIKQSNAGGIFLNQLTLENGGKIIEDEEIISEQVNADYDGCVKNITDAANDIIEEQIFDSKELRNQVVEQKELQIKQYFNQLDGSISKKINYEIDEAKQTILAEALAIHSNIESQTLANFNSSVKKFKQTLNEWSKNVESKLIEYLEEAIAGAELEISEKCISLLQTNEQQNKFDLQTSATAIIVEEIAAIKGKLANEMQQYFANADALQQRVAESISVYENKIDGIYNQVNECVSSAATDVSTHLINADSNISDKISHALQTLVDKNQQLHEQRMQTIEQSVAQILKENIADDQTDVISEARTSARNAVRDALASYKADMSKDLNAQLLNIQKELHTKMQIYVQSYGGGGSVAMQFADGGTMNGTLNVASGQILSAGVDLANIFSQGGGGGGGSQVLSFNESNARLTISPNGNTVSLSALSGGSTVYGNCLPLSGGTISGSVTITNTLSTTTLYATSAYMTVIDITQYELSGFNVTGDVVISGALSATTMHANYIDFTPLSTAPIHVDGRLYYDATEQTLTFWDGDPTLKYPINKMLWLTGVNKTGSTIPKGTVVYLSGAQGNRGKMWPALATTDLRSADTIGITMQTTDINQEGYIMAIGELQGIDTRNFAEGTTLYLSPTAAGSVTSVKPQAPYHVVKVGFALNSTVNGKIYVEIDNGYELDELHNVAVNGISNGQGLVYNSVSALWVNSDLYSGTDLKALSANWQNTYTNFSTQSANNISTYSTVQANSAQWAIDSTTDTGVRALTANWQNTYTNYNAQSGGLFNSASSTSQGVVRLLTQNLTTWDVNTGLRTSDSPRFIGVTATSVISTFNGTSTDWNSTYSTVQANSAQWAVDSTIDTDVRALTANWQNTYSTVQSNSAVWNQTAYLPLSGGTLTGAISTNQDIEITDSTKGIILKSPSNFKYRVTVNDAGELVTTLV